MPVRPGKMSAHTYCRDRMLRTNATTPWASPLVSGSTSCPSLSTALDMLNVASMPVTLRNILVSAKWAPVHIRNIMISIVLVSGRRRFRTYQGRPIKIKMFEIFSYDSSHHKDEHSPVCQNRRPISWDLSGVQHLDEKQSARDQRLMDWDIFRYSEL
jgi:hypothetical protein